MCCGNEKKEHHASYKKTYKCCKKEKPRKCCVKYEKPKDCCKPIVTKKCCKPKPKKCCKPKPKKCCKPKPVKCCKPKPCPKPVKDNGYWDALSECCDNISCYKYARPSLGYSKKKYISQYGLYEH